MTQYDPMPSNKVDMFFKHKMASYNTRCVTP